MKGIRIDRKRHLAEEPKTGHNRWHPDIAPIIEVDEGEEVALETRDALDGFLTSSSTVADFPSLALGAIHPLTGPVLVKGARPGDLLEVEFVDIVPQRWAFSAIMPGLGFLRDAMTTPFLVHWTLDDDWATSRELPGVRIPGAPFMGVSGVAPSHQQVEAWTRREAEVAQRNGIALPPDREGAVPPSGSPAAAGLRTLPPRENGGNFDVKQLSKGGKLLLPVSVDGALFSTGRALRAGRRRGLRHGDRDGRHVRGPLPCAPRRGAAPRHPLAALRAQQLLHRSSLRGAGTLRGHDGDAGHAAGRERGRESEPRLPQRHPEHDEPAPGARLLARAGVRHLQRRRRSSDQQRGRSAERRGVRAAAGDDIRRLSPFGTLAIALTLAVSAVAPAAGATLDELAGALNLVPLHGAEPRALVLERLADGKTVALASLQGRPVLVYFWATWCPHCSRELPSAIEQVHREYGPRGLVVLAVNMEQSRETVRAWARDRGLTMDVLLDVSGAVNSAWGVAYSPEVFVIGRDGRLVARAIGTRGWATPEGRAFFEALMAR